MVLSLLNAEWCATKIQKRKHWLHFFGDFVWHSLWTFAEIPLHSIQRCTCSEWGDSQSLRDWQTKPFKCCMFSYWSINPQIPYGKLIEALEGGGHADSKEHEDSQNRFKNKTAATVGSVGNMLCPTCLWNASIWRLFIVRDGGSVRKNKSPKKTVAIVRNVSNPKWA